MLIKYLYIKAAFSEKCVVADLGADWETIFKSAINKFNTNAIRFSYNNADLSF